MDKSEFFHMTADDVRRLSRIAIQKRAEQADRALREIPKFLVASLVGAILKDAENGSNKFVWVRALGGIWDEAVQGTENRRHFDGFVDFSLSCTPILHDIASAMQEELIRRGFAAKVIKQEDRDNIVATVSW